MTRLGWVAVVLVGGGLARGGEPAPVVAGEVRLSSGAEIASLCEEIAPLGTDATGSRRAEREAALDSIYVMTLPSSAFAFRPYDAARARLAIDTTRFSSSTGNWELVLHDLDGDGVGALFLDMAVPASKGEAAGLGKARKNGELALTVWFRIPAQAASGACATTHNRDGREGVGVRLAIEPMAFSLARKNEVVASGEAPSFTALREESEPVGEPRVVIAHPVLTRTRGQAPDAVARATGALEPAVLACYRAGLTADPTLRGTLVVGVGVDGEGRVTEARAELDGLGAPAVTTCVVGRLRAARFPRGADRFSVPVKFGPAD